jgi:hypothetical protein
MFLSLISDPNLGFFSSRIRMRIQGPKSTGSRIWIRKLLKHCNSLTLQHLRFAKKNTFFLYRDDAANLARAQNQTNHNKEDNHVTTPARKSEPDRGMYR